MDLQRLRDANIQRQQEWPGNAQADIPFRTIEVAGEAGELAEAVKKYLRATRGIKGTQASVEDIKDEMADVIIAIDLLAIEFNIDLSEAVTSKFNKTSSKYGMTIKL